MADETTTGRGYEKPHPTNQLSHDVLRLRAALDKIDADVAALSSGLAGKAATGHSHQIANVTGLSDALAGKAAATHSHALSSLTDVSATGAASGAFLKFGGAGWAASALAIADVTNLQATLTSLGAGVDDGSF